MSNIPADLRYTAEHEYVKDLGQGVVQIGITDFAQGELGDIVFVNMPKAGDAFESHAVFGVVEAVKAVSDLFSPVAGVVTEINGSLDADPSVINRDPYGAGWMIKLKLKDPGSLAGLLSPEAYKAQIGE
jgi:glycine cleavage system H protein